MIVNPPLLRGIYYLGDEMYLFVLLPKEQMQGFTRNYISADISLPFGIKMITLKH